MGRDVRPKTLTLMTKVCDFPCAIYDLTKTLIPYFFCCDWHSCSFVDGVINNNEKVASAKNIITSRPECKNHTLFLTKMAKIDAPFMTKTAAKLLLSRSTSNFIGSCWREALLF